MYGDIIRRYLMTYEYIIHVCTRILDFNASSINSCITASVSQIISVAHTYDRNDEFIDIGDDKFKYFCY